MCHVILSIVLFTILAATLINACLIINTCIDSCCQLYKQDWVNQTFFFMTSTVWQEQCNTILLAKYKDWHMLTVQNAEHKIGKITCTENNNHRPITHKSYMHVTGIKQVILRSAGKVNGMCSDWCKYDPLSLKFQHIRKYLAVRVYTTCEYWIAETWNCQRKRNSLSSCSEIHNFSEVF